MGKESTPRKAGGEVRSSAPWEVPCWVRRLVMSEQHQLHPDGAGSPCGVQGGTQGQEVCNRDEKWL